MKQKMLFPHIGKINNGADYTGLGGTQPRLVTSSVPTSNSASLSIRTRFTTDGYAEASFQIGTEDETPFPVPHRSTMMQVGTMFPENTPPETYMISWDCVFNGENTATTNTAHGWPGLVIQTRETSTPPSVGDYWNLETNANGSGIKYLPCQSGGGDVNRYWIHSTGCQLIDANFYTGATSTKRKYISLAFYIHAAGTGTLDVEGEGSLELRIHLGNPVVANPDIS